MHEVGAGLCLNSSVAIWNAAALRVVHFVGFVFAYSISSFTERTGREAPTATMSGNWPICEIGAEIALRRVGQLRIGRGVHGHRPSRPHEQGVAVGGRLRHYSQAMIACAPGLFSMMIGCPSPSDNRGAITRTIRSLPPRAE